jgi:predicted metal-dependent peptidase
MNQSLALGKVKMAIDRLASDYPLHAGILSQWNVEEDAAVQTMGVGFKNGKLRLIYSAGFVESIPMEQLVGVIHHEANHVLFDHVLHNPEPGENRTARTIAEEVTVNEWVPEPLPTGVVRLPQYPYLPANEDTATRYGKLRKRIKPETDASESNASGFPGGKGSGGSGQSSMGSGKDNSQAGKGRGVPGKPSPGSWGSSGVPTVDNHGTWGEIVKKADQAKSATQMDIATAWGNLKDAEKAKVTEPFASIAKDATEEIGMDDGMGMGIGHDPGEGTSTLDAGTAKVPWQVILRRYVGRMRECRPVFGRPPRRFPDLAGIIPGKGRFAKKPKIMAVIDTSGSMSGPMLADISAELGVMARRFQVTIVECDTAIHAVYPYKPIKTVHGRGGTNFCPSLESDFLRKHKPDLIAYFTDGYGPAPEKAPAVPVIWCITEGGLKPAAWGVEVKLEESKQE